MLFTFFIFICVMALFMWFDFDIRLCSIVCRKSLKGRAQTITREGSRLLLALVKFWLNFQTSLDNAKGKLPKQFILVSNHQSLLDIPVIFYWFAAYKVRFVAKKELGRYVPLISQVLRYQKHCLLDRKARPQQSMRDLEVFARRCMKEGTSPVIFPEGTRSKDGLLGRFHSAGLRRLLEFAPLPVVAIAMDGGYRVSTLEQTASNMKNGGYKIRVTGIYQYPQDKKDIPAMVEEIQASIDTQIKEWHKKNPAGY